MQCKMVKKVNFRWGCDFHRVPEKKDVKVNSVLLEKIIESRPPEYAKILSERESAARFLPVKDPSEFNPEIRQLCEEFGKSNRIDAVVLPKGEPIIDDFKKGGGSYGDNGYSCFGKLRSTKYSFNEEDFPTLEFERCERVCKIEPEPQTQPQPQPEPKIKEENHEEENHQEENHEVEVFDESMYRCLEISGLPISVKADDLKTYLQDFGEVLKIRLNFEKNGIMTALIWITTSACEWVISCLDDQTAVIKDLEVTLKVQYRLSDED
uniref:RRM domain-containing protein n=1 Tax=Strigamia maritima TaxID=126957 RepID=T1IN08_STRMM